MYWSALDGLRAFAVLVVFAGHVRGTPLPGGFIGVDVFFVLSGFLITGLLLREHERHGSVSLRAFYGRRVLRLYPALLLLCVVVLPMAWVSERFAVRSTAEGLGAALVYSFNIMGLFRDAPTMVGNLWSLSVEEQYYLLWAPLLALVLARGGGARAGRAIVSSVVLGGGLLLLTAVVFGTDGLATAYFQLHGHFLELALGGLLAWSLHRGPSDRLASVLRHPAAPVLALAFLLGEARLQNRVDGLEMVLVYPALALASATVIGHLVLNGEGGLGRLFAHPLARWLGVRSYAFYLFHRPVLHLVEESLSSRAAAVAVGLTVSLVLAELSWRLVERPALAQKHRLERVPVSGPL